MLHTAGRATISANRNTTSSSDGSRVLLCLHTAGRATNSAEIKELHAAAGLELYYFSKQRTEQRQMQKQNATSGGAGAFIPLVHSGQSNDKCKNNNQNNFWRGYNVICLHTSDGATAGAIIIKLELNSVEARVLFCLQSGQSDDKCKRKNTLSYFESSFLFCWHTAGKTALRA